MWQYKTEVLQQTFQTADKLKKVSQKLLDEAGRDGWELVGIESPDPGILMLFVFKREA